MTVPSETIESPPAELRFRRRIRYGSAIKELWGARELIRTLAERDLRARYKQALLGFAWAIIIPVILMLVFTLVIRKVANVNTQGIPYPIFTYVALLPWNFFSTSVNQGGQSLVLNSALLNKIYCPREVFPLASVIVAAVDTLISTSVLVVLFVIFGFAPKMTSVFIPILVLIQVAFTFGVALITSGVLVYLRDLRQILPFVLQLGLFATPVAYPIEFSRGTEHVYSFFNPLFPVIDGYRRTVLFGHPPDWALIGTGAASTITVLLLGFWIFKKLESGFADVA